MQWVSNIDDSSHLVQVINILLLRKLKSLVSFFICKIVGAVQRSCWANAHACSLLTFEPYLFTKYV